MENASFAGEGRTGATSDSPARNGIRRSATPRRRIAPPLRTTGCLNEPESTLPVLAFRLSSPKSARACAHHSEFGSPDSSRVRKPIDLCGSFGRIPSTLGLLRVFGRQGIHRIIRKVPCRAQCLCNCASQHGEQILTSQLVKFLPFGLIIAHLCRNLCHIQESKERF